FIGLYEAFVNLWTPQNLSSLPTLAPTLSFPTPALPTPTRAYPTLPPAWTATFTPPPPTHTFTPTPVPPSPPPLRVYGYGPDNFPANVNPLTGEEMSDPALLDHRPLALKIANTRPCARPQSGLNQAALVFEHYVEAWGTRFTAIFYGTEVERIGPVRSARLIDLELPAIFDAMLVASGESAGVKQRLRASDFSDRIISADLGADCPPLCRVPQESVPCQDQAHTLYTNTGRLHAWAARSGLDVRPKLSGWAFQAPPPGGGRPADVVHVDYFNAPVDWAYEADSGHYLRSQDETRQVDALTQMRLTTANVVVLFAHHLYSDIQESSNFYSLEIQFWGQGRALVFRDGQAFEGLWLRPERAGLFRLVDASGAPIVLKPGRTWFEFVALDSGVETQGSEWTITATILPEQTPPRP
ncbi:MAG: DUF3048 domain-containing protein, partial [Chloroflexi bacterium]|nr:DUF3048 domain-containing protein [Chloroflexota bacterium]